MSGVPGDRSDRWPAVVLLAAALVVHGLLLLNDGVYWDGWIYLQHMRDGDWGHLQQSFRDAGQPLVGYLHQALGRAGDPVLAHKLTAFVAICVSVLAFHHLGLAAGLREGEALVLALLFLTYPAFQVSVELIHTPHLVAVALFLCACLWGLQQAPRARWGSRVLTWLLFFLSFNVNSLLCLYAGFLVLLVLRTARDRGLGGRAGWLQAARAHLDLIALPVAFWLTMRLLAPPQGEYAGYNRFVVQPGSVWSHAYWFWTVAVLAPLDRALSSPLSHPGAWLLVALAVFSGGGILRRLPVFAQGTRTTAVVALGLLTLVLATLPYILVAKSPWHRGWPTRHALLVGIGMAILLVGLLRGSVAAAGGGITPVGALLAGVLVFGFAQSVVMNYLRWQARWAMDRSVIANLAEHSPDREVSIFWVDNRTLSDADEWHRFYEWAGMFKSAWGGESHVGFDRRGYGPDVLRAPWMAHRARYNLAELDPGGCQAELVVENAEPGRGEAGRAARYLFYRLFRPERLDAFLRTLTTLQVRRLPSACADPVAP